MCSVPWVTCVKGCFTLAGAVTLVQIHWRDVVFDPKTTTIHIFDSLRHGTRTAVEQGAFPWVEALQQAADFLGDWTVRDSSMRVQFDGYQCGVWAIVLTYGVRRYMESASMELHNFLAAFIAAKCGHDLMGGRLLARSVQRTDRALLAAMIARERLSYYRTLRWDQSLLPKPCAACPDVSISEILPAPTADNDTGH